MYEPREDSFLLEKYVKKLAFGKVLDMGTGSGIQIEAALKSKNVKTALASDIDKSLLPKLKNKNFKVIHSDLFSNIKGKFDTIIFNPPYLPDSKHDDDKSLGGGKKGYELLVRFLNEANSFLNKDGIVLIVFSSITNKKIIDQTIDDNLLEPELLEKKRIFFEELYVYKISKSRLLKVMEDSGLEDIKFFMKGHRGLIFKARFEKKDVAVKIKRPESKAVDRICNEVRFLSVLNKKGIGPKPLFSLDDYFVYEFVKGEFILDYFRKVSRKDIIRVIKDVLKQMNELDKLKINKEEMHHPLKHVVIKNKKPILLDFERCYYSKKPHNVTQFVQFVIKLNKEFKLDLNKKKLIEVSKKYKKEYSERYYKEIIKLID